MNALAGKHHGDEQGKPTGSAFRSTKMNRRRIRRVNEVIMNKTIGKFLSVMLATALIFGSVGSMTPTKARADASPLEELELKSAIITKWNTEVTLTFNRTVTGDVYEEYDIGVLNDGIEILRTGAPHYVPLAAEGLASFTDDGNVLIAFDEPLVGEKNMIRVAANAVADAEGHALSMAQTVTVAAEDTVNITGNTITADGRTVTITFDQSVTSAVPDLKSMITYNSSATSGSPAELSDQDTVQLSGNQLTITLETAWTTQTHVVIAQEALLVGAGAEPSRQLETVVEPAFPAFYYENYGYNSIEIYFGFDGEVFNNLSDLEALKAAITVTRDGSDVPVYVVKLDDEGEMWIDLNANEAGDYEITIAAGALRNASGIVNEEIKVTYTKADTAPPKYVSGEAVTDPDTGKLTVSMIFNADIFNNASGDKCNNTSWNSNSNLRDCIRYQTGDGNWKNLGPADTVAINGKRVLVTFDSAVNGNHIMLLLRAGTIKNSADHILWGNTYTEYLAIEDSVAPSLIDAYFTNTNHDVVLVFDESIQDHTGGQLNAAVTYAVKGGAMNPLADDATAWIEDDRLIIRFNEALVEQYYAFAIAADVLSDLHGNVQDEGAETDALTPSDLTPPELDENDAGYVPDLGGTFIYLGFDDAIADNTLAGGVSQLKEFIAISTDGGKSFTALGDEDWVRVEENYLQIFVHKKLVDGTLIKITGAAVKDADGNIAAEDIVTPLDLNSASEMVGNFYLDADSELTAVYKSDAWGSRVYKVTLQIENEHSITRELSPSQYSVTGNKLVIKQGVFVDATAYYRLEVFAYGDYSFTVYGYAIAKNESFIMTAPELKTDGGITASVDILSFARDPQATVVFQLMKGSTPVANTAVSTYLYYGKVSTYFNVSDPMSPEYSIKAFVVADYQGGEASVGTKIGQVVTREVFEQIAFQEYGGPR